MDKSVALLALIAILDGGYAVFAHALLERMDALPHLSPAGWAELTRALDWVTALTMAALVAAYAMRARGITDSRWLPHAVMQLVMVPLAIGAHYQGPFSSIFWTAFVGAAIVGFLIFDKLPTLLGIASYLVLVTLSAWAAHRGLTAYMPAYVGQAPVQGGVGAFYLAQLWVSSVGLSTVPLGIGYHLIARMREREQLLHALSSTDALTEVQNRRAFLQALDAEFSRSVRHGHPLTLALLDLDHFKDVNDRRGHVAGDRVLRAVARALVAAVRSQDRIGRYGGEEFAILLPETDAQGGRAVAERCRQAVSALAVDVDEGPAVTVTASIGFSSLSTVSASTYEDLVRAADAALYRAKASGRDRVLGGDDV